MTGFVELAAATSFSFLRGASHPADMVKAALALGLDGIGIADRNSVAGVVRAHVAWKQLEQGVAGLQPFRLVVGARLAFSDGTPDVIAYPINRHGWGRLTRLLTTGNLRADKGDCILRLDDLIEYRQDLLLIVMAQSDDPAAAAVLVRLRAACPGAVWLGAAMAYTGRDRRHLARLKRLAGDVGVPLIATNDALYATPSQRPLQDVLTCIREKTTLANAGRRLAANAERYLKAADEMTRLFRDAPDAITQTSALLARIDFTLDELRYEYPHEPVPAGWAPQDWLEHIVLAAAHARYPDGLPDRLLAMLDEEFGLIRRLDYAYYFLTVHDLVAFARAQDPPILCQGRGSAANSLVCFLLGVTSVDPLQYNLLFTRFVSDERNEPPDIDVDFEHERREEVMQYIYRRYGRHRAGIAATVIHYRPRSAVREVGKVLGFTEDVTARLVSTVWGSFAAELEDQRLTESGYSLDNPDVARLKWVVDQLLMFPRHLSQHVGGFVLTQGRLDEMVPILNGAMPDRTFIEWDKDDIDALGLMKVDVLALGMLTCIQKSFALMRQHQLGEHDLEVDLAADDPAVYDMLCKGDSIGVFQVESRAQINMLPRLKPRSLYDLTVQVAIVRPGPIEGEMVHPYLRRRAGLEPYELPSPAPPHDPDELKTVLGNTYGVPLFQEQAMKLAIVAAAFTPGEANQLRRSMATFRNVGGIDKFRSKMIEGMVARGYDRAFAERCYKQIEGFGSYGFPESHALSFARLVYVSSWIKCHHPAVFACALLNAQPMGFYAPAQIVRDAAAHGVEVRAIDVNTSDWDNSLEPLDDAREGHGNQGGHALRLGLRQIDGFRTAWADAIVAARNAGGRFTGIETLARRAALPQGALQMLADADGFGSLGLDRRAGLWAARRLPGEELPLFAAARARELAEEPDMALPDMPLAEQVTTDYQTLRLSLKGHPMQFLRARLTAKRILSCADTDIARHDARISTAGIVLIRQRPGKGNAIFITIEDETGVVNVLLWARLFERYRRAVMASRLMVVTGTVQRSPEGVVHLMAEHVIDGTEMLDGIRGTDGRLASDQGGARHPRNVRVIPKSRDFH